MDIEIKPKAAAEAAVGSIFGDDIAIGPIRKRAPVQLLKLLDSWPAQLADEVIEVALTTPVPRLTVNIEREAGKGGVHGFKLRLHRVEIRNGGKHVGYALRMDQFSLNALTAWEAESARQLRQIRQAH